MGNEFVPLGEYLRRPREDSQEMVAPPPRAYEGEDARALRRFYAAVADVVESAALDLVLDIASDVLARELRLAPADIGGIVERALQRFAAEEPLAVLVHQDDASSLRGSCVPVRVDGALRRGDATMVLRYGSIDLSVGARLADVLRALAA